MNGAWSLTNARQPRGPRLRHSETSRFLDRQRPSALAGAFFAAFLAGFFAAFFVVFLAAFFAVFFAAFLAFFGAISARARSRRDRFGQRELGGIGAARHGRVHRSRR